MKNKTMDLATRAEEISAQIDFIECGKFPATKKEKLARSIATYFDRMEAMIQTAKSAPESVDFDVPPLFLPKYSERLNHLMCSLGGLMQLTNNELLDSSVEMRRDYLYALLQPLFKEAEDLYCDLMDDSSEKDGGGE